MAEAQKKAVALILDTEEAGYLLDLLDAHVGGGLTQDEEPLGRIRAALVDSGVRRLYARNRTIGEYASLFRD